MLKLDINKLTKITNNELQKLLTETENLIHARFNAIFNNGVCIDNINEINDNKSKCVKWFSKDFIHKINTDKKYFDELQKYLKSLYEVNNNIIKKIQIIINDIKDEELNNSIIEEIKADLQVLNDESYNIYIKIMKIYDQYSKEYLKMIVLRSINKLPNEPNISFLGFIGDKLKKQGN
jgi:hypothetical protein